MYNISLIPGWKTDLVAWFLPLTEISHHGHHPTIYAEVLVAVTTQEIRQNLSVFAWMMLLRVIFSNIVHGVTNENIFLQFSCQELPESSIAKLSDSWASFLLFFNVNVFSLNKIVSIFFPLITSNPSNDFLPCSLPQVMCI